MTWYAVQMKPHYDRPEQYQVLKDILVSSYGFSTEDIWISGGGVRKNLYMGYVFLKYHGDKQKLWEGLSRERQIDSGMGIVEIPEQQMEVMMGEAYPEKPEEDIDILDVVEIDDTIYRNMYGVVVGMRDGLYEIGIKMFSMNHFILLPQKQFHKVRSLFEIWKFPKRQK